jgi:large subunit ribosomal protein L10
MNLEQKQEAVARLTAKLKDANAFYLTDFTGLNVKHATELRSRLRKAGVEYIVVKNTLAQRVLEDLQLTDVSKFFTGPTGLVIGRTDPVAAAKVLEEFAKTHNDRPSLKAGIVDRKAVTPKDIGRLAKLPPREQLLAELAGALEAPMAQMLYVLQAKLTEVVGLLDALKAEREASAPAAAEPAGPEASDVAGGTENAAPATPEASVPENAAPDAAPEAPNAAPE